MPGYLCCPSCAFLQGHACSVDTFPVVVPCPPPGPATPWAFSSAAPASLPLFSSASTPESLLPCCVRITCCLTPYPPRYPMGAQRALWRRVQKVGYLGPVSHLGQVTAVTTVLPDTGLLAFLLSPKTQTMLYFPLKMPECCLNLLCLPCGPCSPGGGWCSGWSGESGLTIGRCARAAQEMEDWKVSRSWGCTMNKHIKQTSKLGVRLGELPWGRAPFNPVACHSHTPPPPLNPPP